MDQIETTTGEAYTPAEAEAPTTAKRTNRTAGIIHADTGVVVIDGTVYTLADLPQDVQRYLGLFGLRHFLGQRDGGWEALKAGQTGGRAPAAPKALSLPRQAIVLALVAHAKKTGAVLSQADAEARVRQMSRQDVDTQARHPDVARHLAKLSPAPSLDALLPGAEPAAEAA